MLARLYHAHHNLHPEDLPFWLQLAGQHSGQILELGCGTGRVYLPLLQAGSQVLGIDRDADMLAVLRKGAEPSFEERLALVQADFTCFRLARRFELILMPCNTFSTLSAPERRATLAIILTHLAPAGCFAFQIPSPELLHQLPASSRPEIEETFPHPDDGEPVQASSSWRRSRTTFNLRWDYDHLLPDGQVERHSAQVTHYLTSVEACQEELRQAGFQTFQFFGDFDRGKFTSESTELIVLAYAPSALSSAAARQSGQSP